MHICFPINSFTRDLNVAVTWKSRNPEKVFSFQGYDGEESIVFKVFGASVKGFSERVKVNLIN